MIRVVVIACALAAGGCSFVPAEPGGRTGVDSGDGDDAASGDAPAVDAALAVDARVDAAVPIDAGFDPTRCPVGYVGTGRSRYRAVIAFGQAWTEADADCRDDSTGLTHLIVPDDEQEITAVDGALCGPSQCFYGWTGIIESEGTWRTITGQPPVLRWNAGQPDDVEDPPGRVAVGIDPTSHGMVDATLSRNFATLCECDGRASIAP